MPILSSVETPESLPDPDWEPASEPPPAARRGGPTLWGLGEQITWITGLVLALSALTGWYSGQGEGVTVSVIGWNTGVLGKLVPEYQPVSAESASTRPVTQVTCSPSPQNEGPARRAAGGGSPAGSQAGSGVVSGVSTDESMGISAAKVTQASA